MLVTEESKFRKGDFVREMGGEFLGNGLFLSEGEFWRRQRTLIQPAFYRERIETYSDEMVAFAERTENAWHDGETVRTDESMKRLTLEILAKALFDLDIRGEQSAIRDAIRSINRKADAGSLAPFVLDWVPTSTNRQYRRATEQFYAVVGSLIDERRGDPTGDDFLSILPHATDENGKGMSDETLRDEMATFLFAGHETSALALTYVWYLLSEQPRVRQKLHDELQSVLRGDSPTMADLRDFKYTDKVVTEALRLYPPAYVVFRETREDLEIGGYTIPARTSLTLPQFVIHTDERWYDDRTSSDPERWTSEMETDLPDYAYFPFGDGSRHCIGMRFANAEIRLVVATITQRVDLDCVSDDLDLRMGMTLVPTNPVEMTVRKR